MNETPATADMFDDDDGEKLLQLTSALGYIFTSFMDAIPKGDKDRVVWATANGAALVVELEKVTANILCCDVEYVRDTHLNEDYIFALAGRVFDSLEEGLKNDV